MCCAQKSMSFSSCAPPLFAPTNQVDSKNIQRIQAELAIQQDNAMFFKTKAGISHQKNTLSDP